MKNCEEAESGKAVRAMLMTPGVCLSALSTPFALNSPFMVRGAFLGTSAPLVCVNPPP